jgi:hypothetical protein
MRRGYVFSPRFSLCPAYPERLLCSGDGLGMPDTVLGHVGQKGPLGHAAENHFFIRRVPDPFGDVLGDEPGGAVKELCSALHPCFREAIFSSGRNSKF